MKELDVKLAHDYIRMVDEKDRQYQERLQARADRIKNFMTKMENSVVAEENKKQKFLEDNIIKCEEKKQRQDYVEDETRKKRINDNKELMKKTLREQMDEKNMKKQFNKEINNEYVKIFQDKVARDQEKER